MLTEVPITSILRTNYGYILSAMSIGAIIGAVLAPRIINRCKFPLILGWGSIISAFFLLFLVLAFQQKSIVLILLFLILARISNGLSNTILQTFDLTILPESAIAKVITCLDSMVVIGAAVGSLLGGFILHFISIEQLILLMVIVYFLIGVYWIKNKTLLMLPVMKEITKISIKY